MILKKYADGRGLINAFNDVFESVEAAYTNGVLCVDVPKKEEAKMTSRQIEIK